MTTKWSRPGEHLGGPGGVAVEQLRRQQRVDRPDDEVRRNRRWSLARGHLAPRAVEGAGEAFHQIATLGQRALAGGVDLDDQGLGDGRLVGAELEQLGKRRPQALAPAGLPPGGPDQAAAEPLSGLAVGLRKAVLAVLEVLVESRATGLRPFDHVAHGDLLVAELAACGEDRLENPLARQAVAVGAGEGDDRGAVVGVRKHNPFV